MSGAAPKSKFTLKAGPSRPPPPGKTITMDAAYSSSLDDPEVTATGELADTTQQDAADKRKRDSKRRNKLRKNQARGLEVVAAAPLTTDDLSKHYLLRGDDDDASMADAQLHRDRLAAEKAAKEAKGRGGKETMSNRQKRKIAHELRKAGKPIPEHLTLVLKDGTTKVFVPKEETPAAVETETTKGKKEKKSKKSKKDLPPTDATDDAETHEVQAEADEEEAAVAPAQKRARAAGAPAPSAGKAKNAGANATKGKGKGNAKGHFLSDETARALALLGVVAEKQEEQIDSKLRKEQAKLDALEAKAARRAESKKKLEVARAKALQEVRERQKEKREIAKMLAEDDD